MPVFKITDNAGSAIRGGATREAGLNNLNTLDAEQSKSVLEGLRTNLVSNNTPKHGVLKLRNSSSTGKGMEFARMNGMDRWFSKKGTFANTGKALQILMENSGMKSETAKALINHYSAKDGSIKYKDAVLLINRVLPETSNGGTVKDALNSAGITETPEQGANDKVNIPKDDASGGAFGVVFEVKDHGTPCMLKRFAKPEKIELKNNGDLARGASMDGNHLATGKVPGVIAPNRYLVSRTDAHGNKDYHVVTAGKHFKEFCRREDVKEATLHLEGLIMDKAKGARMFETRNNASEQKEIARGFAAVLMNASSRGIVFGDIKEENAFVDGGKMTLIDTDAAFKHSKSSAKNPADPVIPRTYKHPTAVQGQQQDLYSVGFTLLEHAYRSQGTEEALGIADRLASLGMQADKQEVAVMKLLNKGKEASFIGGRLDLIVGNPTAGSVEEFAVLCIKTALNQDKDYNTRFTGEMSQNHLLEPILSHPLIGGRDEFIGKNFKNRGSNVGSTQEIAPKDFPEQTQQVEKQQVDNRPDSIDLDEEDDQNAGGEQRPYSSMQQMVGRRNRDSSDSEISDEGGDDLNDEIFRNFINNQFKNWS